MTRSSLHSHVTLPCERAGVEEVAPVDDELSAGPPSANRTTSMMTTA